MSDSEPMETSGPVIEEEKAAEGAEEMDTGADDDGQEGGVQASESAEPSEPVATPVVELSQDEVTKRRVNFLSSCFVTSLSALLCKFTPN